MELFRSRNETVIKRGHRPTIEMPLKLNLHQSTLSALLVFVFFVASCTFSFHAHSQSSSNSPTRGLASTSDPSESPPLDPAKLQAPFPRNLWIELGKILNPTVVSITTTQVIQQMPNNYRDPLQDFLEEFWGDQHGPGFGFPRPQGPPRKAPTVSALGTGFIIRKDGLIITNNHVIEQADVIKVQLDANSDKLYEAKVVGRDPRTDIALIKIDAKKDLPVARLGNSDSVQVGEYVAAFGNPYGHAHSMTLGIVSALGRKLADINRFPFIQTDASINPGNSGGPLVNSLGYVVGVNTAIDARAQGIGFAIPINSVKEIVKVLETEGRVRRGYVGIGIATVNDELASSLGMDEPKGVLVTQVLRDGPADKAGIRPYDIIVEFAGKSTDSANDLVDAVADTNIGSEASTKIWRFDNHGKKKEIKLKITVLENPEDQKKEQKPSKQYFGQNAPFNFGFKVADYSDRLLREMRLNPSPFHGPIITEVAPNSPASMAGFAPGDIILDVNRQEAQKASDVLKLLKKGKNILRISRGNMVVIVPLGQ